MSANIRFDVPKFDVLAVGNAIVDVLAQTDDDFLSARGLPKGGMVLIDADQAADLYQAMGPAVESSGGSAANTAVGIAELGGRAAYVGKVANDPLGRVFGHDIRAAGVHFDSSPLPAGDPRPTARSMVLVTPDAERTMSTHLGACTALGRADINEALVAAAEITYVEGYLWDEPEAKAAIRHAMATAKAAGRKVALSLSDPFCVDRHRDEFAGLIDGPVDILFANQAEALAMTGMAELEPAVARLREKVSVLAVTRGNAGAVAATAEGVYMVAAEPVLEVVDTTGAGDLFAAGFLYGLTAGKTPAECARIGAIAAAECINHLGPRPQHPLADLIARSFFV